MAVPGIPRARARRMWAYPSLRFIVFLQRRSAAPLPDRAFADGVGSQSTGKISLSIFVRLIDILSRTRGPHHDEETATASFYQNLILYSPIYAVHCPDSRKIAVPLSHTMHGYPVKTGLKLADPSSRTPKREHSPG